jgi:hypothetical protein
MRSKKTIILLAVLLLVAMVLMLRATRGSETVTEEAKVAALIDAMARAAERRDVKLMRAHLSRSYSDARGRDHEAMNQLITIHYLRKGKIAVYLASKEVEVDYTADPLKASAKVRAVITRGAAAGKLPEGLPETGDALTFQVEMVKEGGDTWMLTSAVWEGIRTPSGLLE